ncbi:MAG: ATP-binding protein [Bacteroidales bacterium]|nr:ATP-binding protein [Bacteroidales bacterium]
MYKKVRIESCISNLRIVENTIDEVMNEIGITQENYGKILVSTLEAVNNAIMHGNKYEKEKMVEVEILFKNGKLRIKISDEGKGFVPHEVPDPTIPPNLEALNGRGIFLMSKLADEIKYSKRGNSVTMYFKNIKS